MDASGAIPASPHAKAPDGMPNCFRPPQCACDTIASRKEAAEDASPWRHHAHCSERWANPFCHDVVCGTCRAAVVPHHCVNSYVDAAGGIRMPPRLDDVPPTNYELEAWPPLTREHADTMYMPLDRYVAAVASGASLRQVWHPIADARMTAGLHAFQCINRCVGCGAVQCPRCVAASGRLWDTFGGGDAYCVPCKALVAAAAYASKDGTTATAASDSTTPPSTSIFTT